MTSNDYINIDNYFQQQLTATEKEAFEQRLATDQDFADEVAFYLNTKAAIQEKTLQTRHAEWQQIRKKNKQDINVWRVVTGLAAMLVVVFGVWFFKKDPTETLTEKVNMYVEQNLTQLPVKMSNDTDSLQLGIGYFNDKKYNEAIAIFTKLNTPQAQEYAGLAALQAKNYDKAIEIFEKIAQNKDLLVNNGKFYLAIVYLKKGENSKADLLLKEVIEQNLGGKVEAERWLK